MDLRQIYSNEIKLTEILHAFSRAVSITLGIGLFHTLQMAKMAYMISKNLGLNNKQIEKLVISALLHDIGINYIKRDLSNIADIYESDIFKKADLDIIDLLDLILLTE